MTITQQEQPGLSAAVASEIRAEVGRQGLSRRRISTELGYSPSYLDRRFSGKVPFRLDELDRVAAYLKLTVPGVISEATERLRRTTLD